MSRKSAVTITIVGLALTLGTAVLRAADRQSKVVNPPPSRSSTTMQEDLARDQEQDEAFDKLSSTEQERRLQEIRAKDTEEQNALIQATRDAEAAAPPRDTCPFRGVLSFDEQPALPMPFHSWQFVVSNYWGGVVNGSCLGVYAGFDPANPLRGELVIWDLNEPGPWRFYPSPTATGPLALVSEANGLLTVTSLKGTYYTYATPDLKAQRPVEVPGGTTYTFDLSSREYR